MSDHYHGASVRYGEETSGHEPPRDSSEPRRKRRPINCATCRHLKIKCDRQIPCAQCVKRGLAHLCPNEAPTKVKDLFEDRERLARRVRELEFTAGIPQITPLASPPLTSRVPMNRNTTTLPPIIPPESHSSRYIDHRPPYGYSPQNNAPILSGRPMYSPPSASAAIRIPSQSSSSRPRDSFNGSFQPRYHADVHRDALPMVSSNGQSRYASSTSPWNRPEQVRPEPHASEYTDPSLSVLTASILSSESSNHSTRRQHLVEALDALGDREEVDVFADSYFESLVATGNSTPLLRSELASVINDVFDLRISPDSSRLDDLTFHNVALVHMVSALGRFMSTEQRVNDSRSRQSFSVAQKCLAHGDFFTSTTIVSLQTLSLMTIFLAYSDIPGGAEQSYQLRGIALRLIIAMGLHRDAHTEQLSPGDLNQRRRVFWDIFSSDVFTSQSLNRPNGLALYQFDTRFPEEFFAPEGLYDLKRCELVLLAKEGHEESLRTRPEPYTMIVDLWQRMGMFEESIPYELRCRPAAHVQVSRHTTPDAAALYTPATSRKDMGLAFKQHSLMLNTCVSIISLLRPYFIDALYTHPAEPLQSEYGDSYLAVLERSVMLIATLEHLHSLFPLSSTRQQHFWNPIFFAAVCLSTVPILSPDAPLAPLALRYLDMAVDLIQQVQDLVPQQSLRSNLGWLVRLQQKAASCRKPSSSSLESSRQALDSGLEDWRSRMVQLVRQIPPSRKGSLGQADKTAPFAGRLPMHDLHNQLHGSGSGRNSQILDVVRAFPPEILDQLFGPDAM